MKKKEDLEAILDLAAEWCMEYGEEYVTLSYVNGAGLANILRWRPDHDKVEIFKEYKEPQADEVVRDSATN